MRKLKLDVDKVAVETFTPESAPDTRGGTVHAHNHTKGHDTCYFSCPVGCTAQVSCGSPCVTGVC